MSRETGSSEFYFATIDLASKFGFSDGDLLADLAFDLREDEAIHVDHRPFLIAAVRKWVVPALTATVELYEIQTIHNPIRVGTVNGSEIDDYADYPPGMLGPEIVTVCRADLVALARALASVEGEET